jgi:hypothetical protein
MLTALMMVGLSWAGWRSDGQIPITPVRVESARAGGTRSRLQVSPPRDWPEGARLIVARGTEPLGWCQRNEGTPAGLMFAFCRGVALPPEASELRGWVIGRDLIASLRDRWPVDGPLFGRIDVVGPGARSAWIDAGASHGIRLGDCWWRRVNGQPVARFDVQLVDREVCFCRVVPLAAGWVAARGERVALWPTPGQRRRNRAASAVSLVEPTEDGQIVWVPAPPDIDAPPEPRVDFYRNGRYVGSGIAHRRERPFWHVRTLPAAGVTEVCVGDDAVIRTSTDIRARRICARVFEQTPGGYLVSAGGIDGLSVGDIGTVYRADRSISRVKLVRVQRSYSVAQLMDLAEGGPPVASAPGAARLQRLDEVRFGPSPARSVAVGTVEHVVEDTLFTARTTGSRPAPVLAPIALRRGDRTIGVAILLEVGNGRALGFAIARSLADSLAPGETLVLPPQAQSSGPARSSPHDSGSATGAPRPCRHEVRRPEGCFEPPDSAPIMQALDCAKRWLRVRRLDRWS